MSNTPPISHTIAGAVVSGVVVSVAPEVYRDVKRGIGNLIRKVQAKRLERRIAAQTKALLSGR